MFETMTRAGARGAALTALVCAGIGVSACTTMGTGTGSVDPGNEPAAFSWKSTDGGISGTMSATLDRAQTFSGPYQQVTSDVGTDGFANIRDSVDERNFHRQKRVGSMLHKFGAICVGDNQWYFMNWRAM